MSVVLCLLAFAGCEQKQSYPVSKRSKVKVALPAEPTLVPRDVKKKHADGVYTVEGAMRSVAEVVGTKVRVRGVVLGLHPCVQVPIEDTEDIDTKVAPKDPESCRPPTHFFLGDSAATERFRLMVTGLSNQALESLSKGKEMTVEGLFDLMTRDGRLIRQAGLLILSDKIETEG
jgi:hypothetical protein